jgi:hypothetical protein
MNQRKKCIATSALLLLASLLATTIAHAADVVGTVANLSGPLLDKKADGSVKVLSQKSSVEQGDTLVSEKNTYARIRFIDNSEITLRPGTQLKVENFSYQADKPEKDSAVFSLVKGGLRSVTGLLGKRNHERFGLNTPTATIGIRGTIFIVEYMPPAGPASAGKLPQAAPNLSALPGSDSRAPGLYVQVLDGMIHVSNGGGAQNFSAGQFGYTPNFQQPPVVLPANPGIRFTPPPTFSSSSSGPAGGNGGGKAATVDCEVR